MGPNEQNACYEPSHSEEPTACYDSPESAAREAQERDEAERRRLEEYDKPLESDPLGSLVLGGLVHGVPGIVAEVLISAGEYIHHKVTHHDSDGDNGCMTQ
jgi:hypothetical protein